MSERVFECELWLPSSLTDVFAFFAASSNLQAITPHFLHFEVLTPEPIEMRAGTLIDYRLRLYGFPFRWRTKITAWEPPNRFVDEQLRGPYRQWIHEHTFEPRNGGTLMKDHVRYVVFGGTLVDRLLVRRSVERIFAFRREKMLQVFGA